MSFKSGRVEDISFTQANLTADGDGLFNVYSSRPINGMIQGVTLYSNSHVTTGSYLILISGLHNSGTALGGLITTLRAGSTGEFYPVRLGTLNNGILTGAGSSAFVQSVANDIIRVVGSGLGANTSGLGLRITYT